MLDSCCSDVIQAAPQSDEVLLVAPEDKLLLSVAETLTSVGTAAELDEDVVVEAVEAVDVAPEPLPMTPPQAINTNSSATALESSNVHLLMLVIRVDDVSSILISLLSLVRSQLF